MNSTYTKTSRHPSKANYALLSPYIYVIDGRDCIAGHQRAFGQLFLYVERREYSFGEAVPRAAAGISGFIYDWNAAGLEYEMTRGGWRNTCWPVVLHRVSDLQSFQSKASSFRSLLCSS